MKLLNCALVAIALSGTGCGSQSPVSPRVLQISGTVRQTDGTAVSSAKVSASIGENTLSSTYSDPAGRFVIVVPANRGSVTLHAWEPPPTGISVGSSFGGVRVEGSPGRITIDIVLDQFTSI
jgi:hypothetical protein